MGRDDKVSKKWDGDPPVRNYTYTSEQQGETDGGGLCEQKYALTKIYNNNFSMKKIYFLSSTEASTCPVIKVIDLVSERQRN